VFENRLRKFMPLQCDPTVIYVLEQEGKYKETLTLSDLRIESPYNTYVHSGLPPGPIGNPGEASLRAAYHRAAKLSDICLRRLVRCAQRCFARISDGAGRQSRVDIRIVRRFDPQIR